VFFRQARKQILASIESGELPDDYKLNAEASLKQFKGSQGPARFQAIARTISGRWRTLTDSDRAPYEKVARQEMEVYKVKKADFLRKKEESKKSMSFKTHQGEPTPEKDLTSSTKTSFLGATDVIAASYTASFPCNVHREELKQLLNPAMARMSGQLAIQ
jgi:hypothetical protein